MTPIAPVRPSLSDLPVIRASDLPVGKSPGGWHFADLVGSLSELSEETPCGALSVTADIVAEAQGEREPVAWVAGAGSFFHPVDFQRRGIDVSAIAVIRAGDSLDSLRCAEHLARSGALGLIVVDAEGEWKVSDSALGRVQKLAERSRCAVLFLTRKRAADPSLGTRIARRGFITRTVGASLHVDLHTVRDVRFHSIACQRRSYDGPAGLHQA